MKKNAVYCSKCNKPLIWNNKLGLYQFQCRCYKKNYWKLAYTIRWCSKCNNFQTHRGIGRNAVCCHCSAKKTKKNNYKKQQMLHRPNFITRNIRFYSDRQLYDFCYDVVGGKIDIKTLKYFSIKDNKVFYKNKNLFKISDKEYCSLGENFTIKPEIYYFSRKRNKYVLWNEFKASFYSKRNTKNIDVFIQTIKKLKSIAFRPNIFMLETGLKDHEWNIESKEKFEQRLVDENLKYFVYIKFYKKDGEIRPLVVGKTGSKLVNRQGSDVLFSLDVNDGPARRFIYEEKVNWLVSQILIIKTRSEKQALLIEQEIVKYFDLFES